MGEALSTLAVLQCSLDWDWREAERDGRRALELKPGHAWAHDYYAMMSSAMARHDEVVRLAAMTNRIEVTLSTDQKAVAGDGRGRQGEFVK
jgi:hypothetical protein